LQALDDRLRQPVAEALERIVLAVCAERRCVVQTMLATREARGIFSRRRERLILYGERRLTACHTLRNTCRLSEFFAVLI